MRNKRRAFLVAEPFYTGNLFPTHTHGGTVPGHHGQLVFGLLSGVPVVCMQGRFHYYEGYNLWKVAKEEGLGHLLHEGVYTCLGGPNFETVAELKMLHMVGVDAVGMSTVHEVITARHCDMTVFAFSLITNECVTSYHSDAEVIDVGKMRQEILSKFVSSLVDKISKLYADDKQKNTVVSSP